MTQLVALLTVPLVAYGCFLTLGSSALHGYLGLAVGTSLLFLMSIAKGAIDLGWGFLSGDTASCSFGTFYVMSGGVGCSPVPVAICYAFILYGLASLILSHFNPKDPHE